MNLIEIPSVMNAYAGFGIGGYLTSLAIGILVIVAWWKIFEQAGYAGWKAIIPVYNVIIMFKLTRIRPQWAWIMAGLLIPMVNALAAIGLLVLSVFAAVRLSRAYNKGAGWAIGLVFLPFIFYPLTAFGYQHYNYSRISNDNLI